jgi:PAS domain S-box-containing protein
MQDAALFPEENPNPVLRAARDGTLLYANPSSASLLKSWACQPGQPVPRHILEHVQSALDSGRVLECEEPVGDRTLSFFITPVAQREYANLYSRDITKRKQVEQALRTSKQELEQSVTERTAELSEKSRYLEAFFEHSLDCLVLLDKQFNFIRVNEVYARACQRPASDFPGHNYFEFFPNAENQAIFEKVVRTRLPFQVSAKAFVFPDHPEWGLTFWDSTLVPVLAAAGEVEFLVFSLRDVTLRKSMEQALEANEARYRSLVTATAQIVWVTNPAGEVAEELPSWEGFTGQTRPEYQGSGWAEALHLEDRERTRRIWRAAVRSRTRYEAEYRLRRHDGRYREVRARGVPVLEEDGSIREWVGTCTDITERKQAERRREFTNALLALFAQKTSANGYLDAAVEVIRNWSECQALGIRVVEQRRQELPYQSWLGFEPGFLELEHCLSLERDHCCCTRVLSRAYAEPDRPLLTPGGSFLCNDVAAYHGELPPEQQACYRGNCLRFGFASVAVVPIRYGERAIGAIHLADRRPHQLPLEKAEVIESIAPLIGEAIHRFQAEAELTQYREHLEELVQQRTAQLQGANARLEVEIAERRRAQETLQQTAHDLERSNRDLEQFAYVASHDLQEPLRAVGGYVGLLCRRFPEALDAKALEYVTGAADGAARMERLITDLLAFSRVGREGASFAPADLNVLLRDALRNLQASIAAAQAQITNEPLPTVAVDGSQIVQVLQNLIGNAIKFRSQAPPQVTISARAAEGHWLIAVQDNGIGIDSQYFERIFQIFQRLHTRSRYPGTGIGLAICQRIVERHGGRIWVESAPGQGSTFYFSLPEHPPADKPVL